MKNILTMLIVAGSFAVTACDVDQTKEAKLPDVDVNATGGQLPEFNVEGPTVNVGTENKTIQVPTIDVNAPKDADGNKSN